MRTAGRNDFVRELRKLAVPLALQNLLHALIGASDSLMLGRLTQEAVAAVTLANRLTFLLSLLHGAFIGAAGILIAQYWGKRDYAGARRFLGLAVRYAAGISFLFFLLSFAVPDMLMRLLTHEPELIEIGEEHLRIISFSYLFSGITHCFLTMMKITGYARLSVWISVVTVAVDMSVDLFLIYGIGPFPALGVVGSALSTVAVEALAMVFCLIWSRRKEEGKLDRASLLRISVTDEKDVWRIIPGMLAGNLSGGLSMTVHFLIFGHLGTAAAAAWSVTGVTHELLQCLTLGVSAGAGIMIGKLLGQNQLEQARDFGARFWRVSFWCGLLNIGLICLAGPLVWLFYVLEPPAKACMAGMMAVSTVSMFAYAYNAILVSGVFPAGGDSRYEAVSMFVATWCFAVPLALLAAFVFRWPVLVVYAIICLDEIVRVPFIRRRYNRFLWLRNLTR